MNLQNQPPIFVPVQYRAEIEKMSKAALMDLAWDYALEKSGGIAGPHAMDEFRRRREIILTHRKQARER